jgi:flagellar motor switch protein FliM
MEKVLNQEEIDAMVRSARSGKQADVGQTAEPKYDAWDVRRAAQIGHEQLAAINSLHETFARNLTHALGAYLRVVFAATLVSAEHLSFREILDSLPETTYLASCRVNPLDISAALQLDLKVAFPIIDLLLGGEGKGLAVARDVTDIEEQILDSVARIICRELGGTWQPLGFDVQFGQRLEAAVAGRLMSPTEKTLHLSFEIAIQEVRGGMNVIVPAAISTALLRKLAADWSMPRARRTAECRERLKGRLLDCRIPVELGATRVRAAVRELAALEPGSELAFARRAAEPATLLVAGSEMFRAQPARIGNMRAARLLERVPEPDTSGERSGAKGSGAKESGAKERTQ